MIPFIDKDLNILEGKRKYLVDKINAHFLIVIKHKDNPCKTKKQLVNDFNNKLNKAIELFD